MFRTLQRRRRDVVRPQSRNYVSRFFATLGTPTVYVLVLVQVPVLVYW
jgi:hypothetical protein